MLPGHSSILIDKAVTNVTNVAGKCSVGFGTGPALQTALVCILDETFVGIGAASAALDNVVV